MNRHPKSFWVALVLFVSLVPGCDLPGKPRPSEQYLPPAKEMTFDVLYQKNCAGCHGVDGTLGPAPPLHNDLFLALVPDAELRGVIARGRSGTLMPAFAGSNGGTLTDEQVEVLAEGIKRQWGPKGPPPPEAPPYASATSSNARSKEGMIVFARACACCHGNQGQGGKLAGALHDADFLALVSDQLLRRTIITGRPDLGMPGYADAKSRPEGFTPLTTQEVSDLVALLASWRGSEIVSPKGN